MTGPDGPPLARSTLDRAAHRRTDRRWLAQAWRQARVLVVDTAGGGRALAVADPPRPVLVLLGPEQAPPVDESARMFLGVEPDGVPVFAVDAALPELPGTRPLDLREAGHLLDERDAGLLTTALALANWHVRHGYSPVTGAPTTAGEAGWSRADEAGDRVWPRSGRARRRCSARYARRSACRSTGSPTPAASPGRFPAR